jgi:hypothetical protein
MREKTPIAQSYGFLDIWKFLHIYCVDMHALDGQYALKYYGFTKINGNINNFMLSTYNTGSQLVILMDSIDTNTKRLFSHLRMLLYMSHYVQTQIISSLHVDKITFKTR